MLSKSVSTEDRVFSPWWWCGWDTDGAGPPREGPALCASPVCVPRSFTILHRSLFPPRYGRIWISCVEFDLCQRRLGLRLLCLHMGGKVFGANSLGETEVIVQTEKWGAHISGVCCEALGCSYSPSFQSVGTGLWSYPRDGNSSTRS